MQRQQFSQVGKPDSVAEVHTYSERLVFYPTLERSCGLNGQAFRHSYLWNREVALGEGDMVTIWWCAFLT